MRSRHDFSDTFGNESAVSMRKKLLMGVMSGERPSVVTAGSVGSGGSDVLGAGKRTPTRSSAVLKRPCMPRPAEPTTAAATAMPPVATKNRRRLSPAAGSMLCATGAAGVVGEALELVRVRVRRWP